MLGIAVGRVFFDALVLSLILYLVARREADYDVPKLAMVVAGMALGNMLLLASLGQWLSPALSVWIMPLAVFAFCAYMIKTFCWVSWGKSLLVTLIFSVLHAGFGFAVDALLGKAMGGANAQASLVEQQQKDVEEIKNEMMRMMEQEARANASRPDVSAPAPTNAAPPAPTGAVSAAAAPEPKTQAPEASPVPAPAEGAASAGAPPPVPAGNWDAARARLKVGGSTGQAGKYVAMVNQRLVETGDIVSVKHEGRTYRWVVRSITRDRVELDPYDVR